MDEAKYAFLLLTFSRYDAYKDLPTMRGLIMVMVMLERSDIQVVHVGRYSMTEGGACQEDVVVFLRRWLYNAECLYSKA